MTRFHFLQNRQLEMRRLTGLSNADFQQEASVLADAYGQYMNQIYPAPTFLRTWRDALLDSYPN